MADLDWTAGSSEPAQVKKELLHEETIPHGEGIRYQIGTAEEYDQFYKAVPVGKQWTVIASIRIIETDV
jgi:hypothetical protein